MVGVLLAQGRPRGFAGASHTLRVGCGRMTSWEYTTTVITHGFMGRQSDELDRGKFQEELSRLGADGWELATSDALPVARPPRPDWPPRLLSGS